MVPWPLPCLAWLLCPAIKGHRVCQACLGAGHATAAPSQLLEPHQGPGARSQDSTLPVMGCPGRSHRHSLARCRRKGKWGPRAQGQEEVGGLTARTQPRPAWAGAGSACSALAQGPLGKRGDGEPTCLAEGVMPCCTTMRARVMFSSCIRWQYTLMVLMPTLGSSGDRAHASPRHQGPLTPPCCAKVSWHHRDQLLTLSGATVPQQGAACPYITWVLEGMQCPRPTGSLWKQGRGIWVCSGASGDLRPADP